MNTAAQSICKEIKRDGAISFARFMALALYCPVCGFYEKEGDTIGRGGDYYTSVAVGNLFGRLLAFQFARWLIESPIGTADVGLSTPSHRLRLVEAGAHDGHLAEDILTWVQNRGPRLHEDIEYCIIEPSAVRRARQEDRLRLFSSRVRWFTDLPELSRRVGPIDGVIFSNELLDAMPVHRLGWDARRRMWFEWGVTIQDGRFAWRKQPMPEPAAPLSHSGAQSAAGAHKEASDLAPNLPSELLDALPDGYVLEICPAAANWWREAASLLRHGRLLTFDYGSAAEERFAPQRVQGTLRAYRGHRPVADALADPGEQDITAHVDFQAIQSAGEQTGLVTERFVSQGQFLTGIAQEAWRAANDFGEWTNEDARQFQTLTHPEHLGRAFRVLVQSRDPC